MGPETATTWRRWPAKVAFRIVRLAAIIYLILMGIVVAFQDHFIYFPTAAMEMTPADVALPYEQAPVTAADGVHLGAWFIPADKPRGAVIVCHGNAGNISHRVITAQVFNRLEMSVLLFDYRGYGQSEGKPSEGGLYRDAEAAWTYLRDVRGIPAERIVIFGESLGGAVATHLAAEHAPAGLMLESTFTSLPEAAGDVYWFLPVRWLLRSRFDTREALKKVTAPVLIAHGRDDELVKFAHGQALLAAANEPKQFLELEGGHNDREFQLGQTYAAAVDAFFTSCLSRSTSQP